MPIIRAQVVLPMVTNLPKDVITNTLWFGTPAGMGLATAGDLIAPRLRSFYLGCYTSNGWVRYLNRSTPFIKFYDWAQPEPRVPYELPMDLSAATVTDTNIPTEVACVLSFHGAPTPGVPAGRRRGRIYLGGIQNSSITNTALPGTFPRFSTVFLGNVTDSAEVMLGALASDSIQWIVYSAATGGITPWYEVVGGWVDESPDTQRRRSVDATARTLWP